MLNHEQHDEYQRDGFLIVRGLFSEKEAQTLRTHFIWKLYRSSWIRATCFSSMDGTEVEMGTAEGGGPCGRWVQKDGTPVAELAQVQ